MLDLNDLDTDDIPGMDRQKGNDLAKAAAVCLECQGHVSGVKLTVRGMSNRRYTLTWPLVSAQSQRTRADLRKATYDGAEGIATLLAKRQIGYTVVASSRIGTGVDYWLGDSNNVNVTKVERMMTDEMADLLQDDSLVVRGRMEVSGILRGSDSDIRERVRSKLRQTDQSDETELPAYVVVVEFGRPIAEVRKK